MANFNVAYRQYKEAFLSKNKLHDHLKSFNAHAVDSNASIIDLTAQPKESHSEGIFNYTKTRVRAY